MSQKKRVVIIGSGNWGSTIAKIVGRNAAKYPLFENEVRMYVHERMVDGHKLSKIINTQHENVKCLPGHKLPLNIVADPDVVHAAADADILIFVVPHVFVARLCTQLKGTVKPGAIGITLIKGFGELPNGEIEVISDVIRKSLGIEVAVLMGANIAHEVAEEQFCETTLGSNCAKSGKILKSLFQTEYFRVRIVPDAYTVEVCGALKNIVACAAGFADGLGHNNNTKAALIRIGLTEMIRFCRTFFAEGLQITTFLESCGVADLITTCYGGRNRLVSEAFVKSGKSIEVLEKELLNGQKLQGYQTCDEVVKMLKVYGHADKFPLFVTVDMIYKGQLAAAQLVERVRMEIVDAQSGSISL